MSLTDEDKVWISGELERLETKLFAAFQKWAAPMDARQRSHSAVLRAIEIEQEATTDRLKPITDRLNELDKKRTGAA
jgi:hypothetical protein